MDASMFVLLMAGAGGGFLRGVVGFIKNQFAYKNVKFEPVYLAVIMSLSAVVGLLSTWAIVASGLTIAALPEINPALAFIVGYAGGDFLENIYKILVGKTSLYPLNQ